jgi:transposase-like protein
VTDQAATYPVVLEEVLPAAWHRTDRYANNRVEADHGRVEGTIAVDEPASRRWAVAFDELAMAI